jgi:group I intron endonuclease
MNDIGIYKIHSISKPERVYIGSSVNITRRWREHILCLRKKNHESPKLQNHYNKHGEVDLQFSILLGCEKEDLLKIEQYFIDSYNPWFNTCRKASHSLGAKQSKTSNVLRSESMRLVWKNKVMTKEERRNRSESHKGNSNAKGKKWSADSRDKMKGNKNGIGNREKHKKVS